MCVLHGEPQQQACAVIHAVYSSLCQGNLGASYGKES